MKNIQTCFLCGEPARLLSVNDGGNRLVIGCSGKCPAYEITPRAVTEVEKKPDRKSAVIKKINAFFAENPEDIPVIRMTEDSKDYYVTTRSREIAASR